MFHQYKGHYYRRLCRRTAEPSQKGDKNQCVRMGKQLPIEQDIDSDLSQQLSLLMFYQEFSTIILFH